MVGIVPTVGQRAVEYPVTAEIGWSTCVMTSIAHGSAPRRNGICD